MTAPTPADGSAEQPLLKFSGKQPPLAAFAAAKIAGLQLREEVDPKRTQTAQAAIELPSGDVLEGLPVVLRYIARAGGRSFLYGTDALTACQVDQWLEFAGSLAPGSALEAACAVANEYLQLRTYLVGYRLSLADLACWGQLAANMQWEKLKKSGAYPHLARWAAFLDAQSELAEVAAAHGPYKPKAAAEYAKDLAAAGRGGGDTGSFDINLPDAAEGNIVTRFPPEPSGYLHVGHAKAALLNQHFKEMYKGRLLVRFDDTNPSKEKDEYVEQIIQDIGRLGLQYEKITYTSDYFPQMEECAEKLIKAGVLYADDTPVDKMREERMDGIESKCRNRSPEETLAVFEDMKKGGEVGARNCLRFKIGMSDPNKAMRDPVAYRCNPTHHWRTGDKYKVYPTYDFACPFVDALEGVTHALRTSEYKDREPQYYWILKAQQKVTPGLPHVHLWDFSRLSFVNTVLSKRKLTWFVDNGKVDGWDDPRMPTVQGMFRRGLQLAALKEFILAQGASKNVTLQEWEKLWTINKRLIDPVAPRHTAVTAAGRVPLTLSNGPEVEEVEIVPAHKKNPEVGQKASVRSRVLWLDQADAQAVADGEEVTLMDWGNAIIRGIEKDDGGQVSALTGELHLEGSVKTTKLKLTWLPQNDDLVLLTCVDFGHLITKKKPDEDDKIEDLVNPHSRWETAALGDGNMRNLRKGDIIQLERKGYFIVDRPLISASKPLVLLSIPDGRAVKTQPPAAGATANGKT